MASINIADLTTTSQNVVIHVRVGFSDRARRYAVYADMVEINGDFRSMVIDFRCPGSVTIENNVKRFSQKTLQKHADNWRNTPGVKELIEKILEVRELELTEEAKAFAGLW